MALLLGPMMVLADPPLAAPAGTSSAPAAASSATTAVARPGEPVAAPAPAATPLVATPVVATSVVDAHPIAPPRNRPLDLRLGDLRRYFTPSSMQSPLPDVIGDEVVIEGGRSTASESVETPIPVGLVAPFWAMSHPLSAWRIFLPDPNAQPLPPPDPIPHYQP